MIELFNKRINYILPVIVGLLSPINFTNNNLGVVSSGVRAFTPIILFTIVVCLIIALLAMFLSKKDKNLATLNALLVVISFFWFKNIASLFTWLNIESLSIGSNKIALGVIVLLIIGMNIVVSKKKPNLTNIVGIASKIAIILFVISSSSLLYTSTSQDRSVDSNEKSTVAQSVDGLTPDIWYIVPDSHPSFNILEDVFDYDTAATQKTFEDMGFFIADNAHSNYAHTFLSLPSTLNFEYMNYLTEEYGEDPENNIPPLLKVSDNKIEPFLKDKGYKIANIGTGWYETDKTDRNDVDLSLFTDTSGAGVFEWWLPMPVNDISIAFLSLTPLQKNVETSTRNTFARGILDSFTKAKSLTEVEGPTFSLVHINSPHPPYIFDAEGNIQEDKSIDRIGDVYADSESFLEQTKFINKKLQETVKHIVDNNTEPTVIILAADHGSTSNLGHPFNWGDAKDLPDIAVKERMEILSMFYFSDQEYSTLYDEISPVNNLRVVLNKYFDADLEILDDEVYYSNYKKIYDFQNVNDRL